MLSRLRTLNKEARLPQRRLHVSCPPGETFMLTIRPATVEDAPLLRTLIRELADYEHGLELVTITDADIARDGFGPDRKFRAVIAAWDGHPAGYAVFFEIYSTWHGRPALFLEDILVREQFRGKKIG